MVIASQAKIESSLTMHDFSNLKSTNGRFLSPFWVYKEISETLKYPWQMKPPPFAVPKSLQDLQQPGKKRNLTRVKLVISPITFTADKGEVFIQSHGVPTGGQFGS